MPIFEGSVQDFHNHIGPRIRNAINLYARRERLARKGRCEKCGKTGQTLESAHVHGRDRRTIIESVLQAYQVNGRVRCDIAVVERKILAAHGPIAQAFRFLCKDCHRDYDKHPPKPDVKRGATRPYRGAERTGWMKRIVWAAAAFLSFAFILSFLGS